MIEISVEQEEELFPELYGTIMGMDEHLYWAEVQNGNIQEELL